MKMLWRDEMRAAGDVLKKQSERLTGRRCSAINSNGFKQKEERAGLVAQLTQRMIQLVTRNRAR